MSEAWKPMDSVREALGLRDQESEIASEINALLVLYTLSKRGRKPHMTL